MKFLTDMFGFWILSLVYFICSSLVCSTKAGSNQKNSIPHLELSKGNKQGLLRQHRMVGEFLECTYIEHTDPYLQNKENDETYYPGTGIDRSKSRVVSLESIDISSKIIKTLECQMNIIKSWKEDINKTLKENLFSVIEVRGWRAMTRPQSLYGEADEILSILENKNSSPLSKVKEAVDAFENYTSELHEAYLEFKDSEDRLKDASTEEERRTRAQVAVLILGQKESKSLFKFTRVVRNNSDDARESRRLMERLYSLLSSESYSNSILQGIELIQICFFLLNGLNVLSVFEEQRLSNKFRRDMYRRNLIYQNKIEEKTLSKYPKFSNSSNFNGILDFLLSTVKKSINTKNESKIKNELIQTFDKIVEDFGIRCPYFLTSILRSGRNYFSKGEEILDDDTVKNCRLAWKEVSLYLYKEGQILPSAAIRQALKKALNKHIKTVYIWPRNAVGLFKKIFNQSDFESSFDISNEKRFISTCSETVNSEIGLGTSHSVSLDEIAIVCFNFFNLLEFYTEQYNYGSQEKLGKDGNPIRETKKNVNISTLPSKIKAKALDVAFSETLAGVMDFPPFKSNDLDRTVIGILAENFIETCIQRVETVLGKSSKYRISNPQTICTEARIILKDYNIISQKSEKIEGELDIFDQFNILDTSLITKTSKSESENSDTIGHLKLLQSKLGSLQPKSQPDQSKDIGISPIKQLDPIKAYNLVRKMHLDWMEEMRNDPRYKGFTDLELKNNSPWNKQAKLWHELITPELPEIRYAASYLNGRPSRFPLIPGDKRGKHKKITPLEELLNEDFDPKYRARYSLVENGPFDEQDFYYDDQYDSDGDSIAAELAQTQEYYTKKKDGSYIKSKHGSYTKERSGKYIKTSKGDYKKQERRSYIRNKDLGYYVKELKHSPSGLNQYKEQIVVQPIGSDKEYYGNLYRSKTSGFANNLYTDNGCKYEELPLLWGQRATTLYENMIKNFKEVKYRGKYGPGHFVSMDDICYILERDFKVKRNYFEDISKVNLLDCQDWFTKYLSKLWPPFGMESIKTDVKTLCWDSGFRGWL